MWGKRETQKPTGCATLGAGIAEARRRRGCSQAQLAMAVKGPHGGETTRSALAQWEVGNRGVNKGTLDRIAAVLGVTFDGVEYGGYAWRDEFRTARAGKGFKVSDILASNKTPVTAARWTRLKTRSARAARRSGY